MKRLLLPLLLSLLACDDSRPPPRAPQEAAAPPAPPTDPAVRAHELARSLLVVDGHIDLPYRLQQAEAKGEPPDDVGERCAKGDFDWVRARAGGLDAPFMSIYVPASHQVDGGAKALADRLIDRVEAIVAQAPDKFALAPSVSAVEASFAAGKIALPLGIENGAALEGDLANVEHFHARGVRYITLTHSKDNDICDSSYDEARTHRGLSAFGREVVAAMNRTGIMVDVSHISDDAFWQVMEATQAPAIASHSSCRHFVPGFERNMNDDMIRRLAAGGGVIMVNFGSTFLTAEARDWSDAFYAARTAFMQKNGFERDHPEVEGFFDTFQIDRPLPYATVETVADHIDHVVKLVGIDHVGLGSDFDGVGDSLPIGLKSPEELPNLFRVLLERGYGEAELEKLAGQNLLRVWRVVEEHGKLHQPIR
jgi:membrane dipeptidase